MKIANEQGRCRSCGAELVDWSRVHSKNLSDVAYTFHTLRLEMIRHYFWHLDVDGRAIAHARRKGRVGIRTAAETLIRSSIGKAAPSFDGRQTPKSGNIVYYAQHATASCCRTCLEIWHGIPKGRELDDSEITYLAELARLYIDERLPQLTELGERVPPRRRAT